MAHGRRDLILALVLAIGVVAGLSPFLSPRMPYDQDVAALQREDEGTILYDARRIADGQVMYRDFFEFYTPGGYYYLATAMKIGGRTIRCARFATLLTVGITAGFLFLIGAAQLRSRWLAAVLALVYPFGLFPFWPFAFPYWHAMMFLIIALGLALWYVDEGSRRVLVACGVAVGLAFLVLQESGLPALIAIAGFFLARAAARPPSEWRRALRALGREEGLLFAGFLAPCVVCAVVFAAHGALGALVHDVFVFPFTNYRVGASNDTTTYGQNLFRVLRDFLLTPNLGLPPGVNMAPDMAKANYYQMLALHLGILVAAPIAVVGALVVFAAGTRDTIRGMLRADGWVSELLFGEDASLLLIALYVLAILLPIFLGVSRKDTSHVAFLSLPGWILLFRLAAPRGSSTEVAPGRRAFGSRAAIAALCVWVFSAALLHERRAALASSLPGGGLGFGNLAAAEAQVADTQGGSIIDFLVPPGGRIAWASHAGWPLFSSHRDDATPFTFLVPPPYNDLSQWEEAAREVERDKPYFLVAEEDRGLYANLSHFSPWIRDRYGLIGELRPGGDLYALDDGPGPAPARLDGVWHAQQGGLSGTATLTLHGTRLSGQLVLAGRPPTVVSGAIQPDQIVLAAPDPAGAILYVGHLSADGQSINGQVRSFANPAVASFSLHR
jgi:hypothetical protein